MCHLEQFVTELFCFALKVVFVVSSDVQIKSNEKILHKIYKVPYEPGFSEELLVKPALEGNQLKGLWALSEVQRVMCECLLNDTKLLQELKDFDLIVYEGSALCAVLVGDLLDIPRVVIAPGSPNGPFAPLHMIPTPVSYVPQQLTGFSCNMTFIQRVVNLGAYFASQLFMKMMFAGSMMGHLKTKYNIKPEISYPDAVANVELMIVLADFALEYPQPLPPGMANTTTTTNITIGRRQTGATTAQQSKKTAINANNSATIRNKQRYTVNNNTANKKKNNNTCNINTARKTPKNVQQNTDLEHQQYNRQQTTNKQTKTPTTSSNDNVIDKKVSNNFAYFKNKCDTQKNIILPTNLIHPNSSILEEGMGVGGGGGHKIPK